MLHLKKYFSEGLVQVAILLSLCGMMVDVGLEPYLPPSWQEMIRGPTSALTQTQFHNLRNRLEDGQDLHPKSVDLDGFFTARRLLGSVRSLDRLQVPQTELEAWLVQREPDPLPVDHQDQLRPAPPVDPRPGVVSLHGDEDEDDEEEDETHHLLFRGSAQEDDGEEEDLSRLCRRAEGGGPEDRGESTQTDDQTSVFQACLRLLEETFPFSEEHQLNDGGDGGSDVETLSPPIIPSGNPPADLEMHWQDLLAIMEPTPTAGDVDMITSPDLNQSQRLTEPEALQRNNHHDTGAEAQHGFSHPELESLTSIAELDQQSAALNPPQHADLLAQFSSGEFIQGQNAENSGAFSTDLLTQDLLDMDSSLYTSFYQSFENFEDPGVADSSVSSPSELSDELGMSPSSVFLFEQEDGAEDEDGLLSPLGELLEDELRLLDLALEEGFSPEMTTRLEEEGYLEPTTVKEETGGGEDQFGSETTDQQSHHQQDNNTEADSDSGLSLDFSHSPASPCASEASSYSSSSSSSSSVGSPFSEDEEADEGSFDSEMEDEVTVKQEELDEEEMGAVGGEYPGDVSKAFSCNHDDHKMFSSLHWTEHIGHDHTYNQPRSSPGKTKPSKSISQHDSKPYLPSSSRHLSDARMWSRDERRARALKVPFSNEMIVNLPVDEFNDLLEKYTLSEEQLALIRDIRRRGKNKIAAQNCRRRKMDVLLGLKDDVAGLRRYRSRLLREKQEALRSLQEMKRQLGILYQEVFSRLRDEAGRPLDAMEYLLQFEPSGGVMVASRQQRAVHPLTKTGKKQKDKKK